ncbi:MAG: thioredoxin domain-containing protein [Candidatus Gastranaerophilales bacterium]|nr:thioredoxin domain-containing protein [Candidatus Gastranaerophilales bacterium]
MKKKIFSILILLLLICGIGSCYAAKTDIGAHKNFGVSYTYAYSQPKPFILYFYTDWCTYCRAFKPKLDMIYTIYSNRFNFVAINCDDPFYKNIITEYNIQMYPVVFIVDRTSGVKMMISPENYDDISKMRNVLDEYLSKTNTGK